MPRLLQRANGAWYIELHRGRGGRQVLRGRDGEAIRDKAQAEKVYRETLAMLPSEEPLKESDPRIVEALDYYERTYLVAINAAKKTRSETALHLYTFTHWCASQRIGRVSQLSNRKMDEYAAWIIQQKPHPTTARKYIATVRAALNKAMEKQVIPAVNLSYTLPRGEQAERGILTQEQLRSLMALFWTHRDEMGPIVQWIANTGQRPSDAVRLEFRQIDMAARSVTRPNQKTRILRQFPIGPGAVDAIEKARAVYDGDGPVFRRKSGKPYTANTLYHDFKHTVRAARFPLDVTPYTLRHTFASILVNELRCPITTVRVLMNHASITTTAKYVRASDGGSELAALGEIVGY